MLPLHFHRDETVPKLEAARAAGGTAHRSWEAHGQPRPRGTAVGTEQGGPEGAQQGKPCTSLGIVVEEMSAAKRLLA